MYHHTTEIMIQKTGHQFSITRKAMIVDMKKPVMKKVTFQKVTLVVPTVLLVVVAVPMVHILMDTVHLTLTSDRVFVNKGIFGNPV